ncbi:MAG: diphosphomevalonate decarboxylase [Weeksellaceae bacterium]
MKTVTTQAPANIAFIKYWGFNEELVLPFNESISMNLSNCTTTTTVKPLTTGHEDIVEIEDMNGVVSLLENNSIKGKKVYETIKRIRAEANATEFALIRSKNSFPSDAGIASSASGFAALTTALLLAYGLDAKVTDKKELSREVRRSGSASAARSVYDGFVELKKGTTHEEAYAVQLADEKAWELVDIVAVVDTNPKKVGSSEGHVRAEKNPYYQTRLQEMQDRIEKTRLAIAHKQFDHLGPCIEQDTLSMHAVIMTSQPPILYWESGTIAVMKAIMEWRHREALPAYFSIDAGPNVHVICEKENAAEVEKRLAALPDVKFTIFNEPAVGVNQVSEHLF